MKVEVIISKDGSNTLFVPSLNEHYHSTNGAITEALHVYVKEGLQFYIDSPNSTSPINVLEIGFGTGLNALVSGFSNTENSINYDGLELNPLPLESITSLNYTAQLGHASKSLYKHISESQWDMHQPITDRFILRKLHTSVANWQPDKKYQVVYFDAFAPEVQPEMWEIDILEKIANQTVSGGVLTTYCAKGEVRRRFQAVGFKVYRIPGPPGKREMIRAVKI